jgi:hypothetical protein
MEGVELGEGFRFLTDVVVAGDEAEPGLEGVEGERAAAELEEIRDVVVGANAGVGLES